MRDREPFTLGFEGEFWEGKLPGLCIPIPIPDDTRNILVMRTHDGSYRVFTMNEDEVFDSVLMLASYIQNFIDNYHAR